MSLSFAFHCGVCFCFCFAFFLFVFFLFKDRIGSSGCGLPKGHKRKRMESGGGVCGKEEAREEGAKKFRPSEFLDGGGHDIRSRESCYRGVGDGPGSDVKLDEEGLGLLKVCQGEFVRLSQLGFVKPTRAVLHQAAVSLSRTFADLVSDNVYDAELAKTVDIVVTYLSRLPRPSRA